MLLVALTILILATLRRCTAAKPRNVEPVLAMLPLWTGLCRAGLA